MQRRKKTVLAKSKAPGQGDKVYRLAEIEPEFVSLVPAGANRQKAFQVVKEVADSAASLSVTGKETAQLDTDVINAEDASKGQTAESLENTETKKEGTDLSSWLDEAGEKMTEVSLAYAVQNALESHPNELTNILEPATKKAQENGNTGAPTVAKNEEAVDHVDDPRIEDLEETIRKLTLELTKAKATASRLTKGIGNTSVMVTGEVVQKTPSDNKNRSPSNGTFKSGGDIAAAVVKRIQ